MCRNCWIDEGGHKVENENTRQAVELIAAVYNHDQGCVGGYGHVVFDDFNISDEDVDWCIAHAIKHEFADCYDDDLRDASLSALENFKRLSHDERCSALAKYHGYF